MVIPGARPRNTTGTLFLTGAVFNWLVGLALHFDAGLLFELFRVTPAPTEPLFVQLFAWLVIVFGVGYLWVSRDPPGKVPIIWLGILGKAADPARKSLVYSRRTDNHSHRLTRRQ
jgi:hypothetical protein